MGLLRGRVAWALVFALAAAPARAGDAEDVARLGAANTAAVTAPGTLHFKARYTANPWGIPEGEYWRAGGGKERFDFTHKGNENRAVVKDKVVRYTVRQDVSEHPNMKGHPDVQDDLEAGRYFWHGGVERHDGTSPFLFKPLLDAMCRMSDGGQAGNVTFAQFARNHAREVVAVRRAAVAGVPTEVVEFKLPTATVTVHLDPAAGHMIRRSEYESDAPQRYGSSSEVVSFKQAAPGVFLPEKVVIKRSLNGRPEPDEVVTFSDVVVNEPVPDATFDLKYRPGMRVTDRIARTVYAVDVKGARVGQATPIPVPAPDQ